MHEKNIFLDKPMITSSHFNRLYRSLYVNISVKSVLRANFSTCT